MRPLVPYVPYPDFGPLVCGHQVYRMDEAPSRLERIASLEEHDDMVTCVAAAGVHRRLVLSGSWDKRYGVTSSISRVRLIFLGSQVMALQVQFLF